MRRAFLAAGLAALVAGCGTFAGSVPGDANREVLGVAAHQPSRSDRDAEPAVARTLAWKASQLCTLGYDQVAQNIVPAEGDKQFVDRQLRCRPYGLSALGVPLAGIVPTLPLGAQDR